MAASIGKLILGSSSCKNEMPILGLGTASYPFSAEQVKAAVLTAIKLGYRHFDTASLYGTEQTLGEAVREAVKLGLIESRDELFITSKLWCSDAHPNLVLPAIQKSLRTLQMEYLDLYLIHWPLSVTPGKFDFPAPAKEDLLPMDYESVWSQMEECQKLGLTKSIGVSNFTCKKLDIILATAKIPPAVDQVEMNIIWQQKKLVAYCKEKGIIITAFSPLGASGTSWGTNNVMESEVLNEIAKAIGKSNAQICLRWLVDQGASIVVKSFNEQRMKENMDIFDWELNAEQLKTMSEIPQRRGYPGDVFTSPTGPFKNEEELWDGEV